MSGKEWLTAFRVTTATGVFLALLSAISDKLPVSAVSLPTETPTPPVATFYREAPATEVSPTREKRIVVSTPTPEVYDLCAAIAAFPYRLVWWGTSSFENAKKTVEESCRGRVDLSKKFRFITESYAGVGKMEDDLREDRMLRYWKADAGVAIMGGNELMAGNDYLRVRDEIFGAVGVWKLQSGGAPLFLYSVLPTSL